MTNIPAYGSAREQVCIGCGASMDRGGSGPMIQLCTRCLSKSKVLNPNSDQTSLAVTLTDEQRLDWLQEQGIDVIYLRSNTGCLDDSRAIGIYGGSVRDAIDAEIARTEKLEKS